MTIIRIVSMAVYLQLCCQINQHYEMTFVEIFYWLWYAKNCIV